MVDPFGKICSMLTSQSMAAAWRQAAATTGKNDCMPATSSSALRPAATSGV